MVTSTKRSHHRYFAALTRYCGHHRRPLRALHEEHGLHIVSTHDSHYLSLSLSDSGSSLSSASSTRLSGFVHHFTSIFLAFAVQLLTSPLRSASLSLSHNLSQSHSQFRRKHHRWGGFAWVICLCAPFPVTAAADRTVFPFVSVRKRSFSRSVLGRSNAAQRCSPRRRGPLSARPSNVSS